MGGVGLPPVVMQQLLANQRQTPREEWGKMWRILIPEQAKLRAGLDSVIIREKPNVKWSDAARLESAKQVLQKAVILPVKFLQFFVG